MILVAAPMTYLWFMQGFSAARIPRRRGSTIEDQQLRTGPTISIVDDDESMRCAVKSLVTSLGFAACTFASAEEFLQSPRLDDTACLITDFRASAGSNCRSRCWHRIATSPSSS